MPGRITAEQYSGVFSGMYDNFILTDETIMKKSSLSKSLRIEAKRAEYTTLRAHLEKIRKKSYKMEKHARILTKKLSERQENVQKQFDQDIGKDSKAHEIVLKNKLYRQLVSFEDQKIKERLVRMQDRCNKVKTKETELQKIYAEKVRNR